MTNHAQINHPAEVYVRGNVSQNTKGWNKEHTVSFRGDVSLVGTPHDEIVFMVPSEGGLTHLEDILDALHQEADAANQREINRQRQQQLAAIRAE